MLAQFVFNTRHHITRRIGGHQKSTHAPLARALVRHRDHDGHVAILAAGDELFDAVDDVFIPLAHGGSAQAGRIAAHMGLGQAEGAQHLAVRQRYQPLLLLRLGGVLHQDGVDRTVGNTDDGAGAAVTGCNFFQYQGQRHVVQVGSAIGLGHTNAIGAQRGQALVCFFGKVVLFVPLGSVGPQLGLGEFAHGVAHHLLVLGQQHKNFLPGQCLSVVVNESAIVFCAQLGHRGTHVCNAFRDIQISARTAHVSLDPARVHGHANAFALQAK